MDGVWSVRIIRPGEGRDRLRVRAPDAVRAHDLAREWRGWLTQDVVYEGEALHLEPFDRDRRYRFSVQLWKDGRYVGTDTFEGRVIDCIARVQDAPGGAFRDIPLRDVIKAEVNPCKHTWFWDPDQGYECVSCGVSLYVLAYHPRIVRETSGVHAGKYKLFMYDPSTRKEVLRHIYPEFARAMKHASMMVDNNLASGVEEK